MDEIKSLIVNYCWLSLNEIIGLLSSHIRKCFVQDIYEKEELTMKTYIDPLGVYFYH